MKILNKSKEVSSNTDQFLLKVVAPHINRLSPQTIVHYNSGHGSLSKEILSRLHPESILHVFEQEIEICLILCKIQDSRLRVRYLPTNKINTNYSLVGSVDCIISPGVLSHKPVNKISEFLVECYFMLKNNGILILLMDSEKYKKMLRKYFKRCDIKIITVDPACFIYKASNKTPKISI